MLFALIWMSEEELEKLAVFPLGVVMAAPPDVPVPETAQAPSLARVDPLPDHPVARPGAVPSLFPRPLIVIGPLFARTSTYSSATPQPAPQAVLFDVLPRPVKVIPPPLLVAKI
jgi:hypothetical protein